MRIAASKMRGGFWYALYLKIAYFEIFLRKKWQDFNQNLYKKHVNGVFFAKNDSKILRQFAKKMACGFKVMIFIVSKLRKNS